MNFKKPIDNEIVPRMEGFFRGLDGCAVIVVISSIFVDFSAIS